MTPDICKLICFNLTKALDALHHSNVIHRDLKTANVLIQDDFSIKICDFGLSRTNPRAFTEIGKIEDSQKKEIGDELYSKRRERRK